MAQRPRKAVIFGCAGEKLTEAEKAFFTESQPWGFILFARNCADAGQIRNLCAELRETVNDPAAPVLIDQEGGRVARLRPPLAPARPPMDRFGALYKLDPARGEESAFLGARLIAEDLFEIGVNVNCVPVLDVPQPDAHEIIGDRALATHPDQVGRLGRQVIEGSLAGGVLPIIKHIPGHGRALSDSHLDLPVVQTAENDLRAVDFVPFQAVHDAPMAMTAHVIYSAFDAALPATLSPLVIDQVIRGEIGFDGLLMTDDLSMKALSGSFEERGRAAIAAGCDILLHCNGDMAEMQAVAAAVPVLQGRAQERAAAATAMLQRSSGFDRSSQEKRFAELLKPVVA